MSFQVKLMDSVVSALEFAKAKEVEIAWVDAHLEINPNPDEAGMGVEI